MRPSRHTPPDQQEKKKRGKATYDLVGKVVKDTGLPLINTPLALLADHPLQLGVAGARLATDPAGLELSEVALEEVDLVLAEQTWGVVLLAGDGEVIPHLALVDGRRRLRN